MIVCEKCKRRITGDQPDENRSFPAYGVLGGLAGAFGAAVTGSLILVPLAVVAGVLADGFGRRCGVCSSEIGPDESAFEMMEESGDDLAGRSYRPVGAAESGRDKPQRIGGEPAPLSDSPRQRGVREGSGQQQTRRDDGEMSTNVTFREYEGRLVPSNHCGCDSESDSHSLGGSPLGVGPETDDDHSSPSWDDPLDLLEDGVPGFDDLTTDIDDVGGIDDVPLGGYGHE